MDGSELVGFGQLSKIVNDGPMTIIRDMLDLIRVDGADPHVIVRAEGLEDIHCDIRPAELRSYGSVSPISSIDRPVLVRSVANHGFGTFEGMHMVLKDCHNFVLIEVGDPVEQSV